MIGFLVGLLLLGLCIYVVYLVLGMIPLPEPVKHIVTIIIAIIFLVMLLKRLGIDVGGL